MAPGSRLTLPNIITLARIAVCPVLFFMTLAEGTTARYGAFLLFLAAALSDIWDGYLARKHGLITDMGKLLDPFADKLLLAVTFIPIYMVSHRPGEVNAIPWWGELPAWVLIVIFGRELFITVFRQWAQRRGVVIAAGQSGKQKAAFQNIFVGAILIWWPMYESALERGWIAQGWWRPWEAFVGAVAAVSLALALVLTVYSMLDYLWSYRSLVGVRN